MTQEQENEIHEIKMKLDDIMSFIVATDKITNTQFCTEENIHKKTLESWFKKDCPRLDNRHVSRSAVKKWKATNATHATAKVNK